MDYGISFANAADNWKVVKRAEALGFSHAWFSDTQMLNADTFVTMAAAAVMTDRINLGTAVLVPTNRIAPVTANALASLNALAPGRIHLGISTGFTARRAMGLGAITLGEMAEYIDIVRRLLDGDTVEWDHGERRRKIRFLNPELGLINIDDPIPLHISAFGPKGRRLTAGIRDAHWMASIPNVDIAVTGLGDMHDAWRAAGKDPSDFYTTAISSGTVLDENEPFDSPRAKAEAGPPAALVLHKMAEDAEYGGLHYEPPGFLKRQFEKYREIHRSYEPADARYLAAHRGHLLFLRADEEALITGEMIEAMTITGTREALRDSIRELKRAGYSQFSAHIRYGHEDALERWADVFELV